MQLPFLLLPLLRRKRPILCFVLANQQLHHYSCSSLWHEMPPKYIVEILGKPEGVEENRHFILVTLMRFAHSLRWPAAGCEWPVISRQKTKLSGKEPMFCSATTASQKHGAPETTSGFNSVARLGLIQKTAATPVPIFLDNCK